MADNAASIITVAEYEAYAGVTVASGVRTQYEALALYVTRALETFWHRKIITATYRHERYDGGSDMLFLKNYPVTDVGLVSSGDAWVIRVRHIPYPAFNPYVVVSATGVSLYLNGTLVTTKTFAAYPTIALLVAALQTADWEIVVASTLYDYFPSNQLISVQNAGAYLAGAFLSVPWLPVSGYVVIPEDGIIQYESGFPPGDYNIIVTYTAGYADTASVPAEMKLVALRLMVVTVGRRKQDESMKSESLGDYSYTAADVSGSFDVLIQKAAYPFKRILI